MFKKILALLIIFSGLSLHAMKRPSNRSSTSSSSGGKENKMDTRQALWGDLSYLPNEVLEIILLKVLQKYFDPENSFYWNALSFCNNANANRELLGLRIKYGGFNIEELTKCITIESLITLNKNTIVSGLVNGVLNIWELKENKLHCVQSIIAHMGNKVRLAEINETTFASGSKDGTIKIWQNKEGKWECTQILAVTPFNSSWVRYLTAINETTFVSGSLDGAIKIWHLTKGTWHCIQTIKAHGLVTSLIKINETTFASGSYDRTIKIWELRENSWQCVATLRGHNDRIECVTKLDERTIVSGARKGTIIVWHKNDEGSWQKGTILKDASSVASITTLNSRTFVSGAKDLSIWRLDEDGRWKCMQRFTDLPGSPVNVPHFILSLTNIDQTTFASGSGDGSIHKCTVKTINQMLQERKKFKSYNR